MFSPPWNKKSFKKRTLGTWPINVRTVIWYQLSKPFFFYWIGLGFSCWISEHMEVSLDLCCSKSPTTAGLTLFWRDWILKEIACFYFVVVLLLSDFLFLLSAHLKGCEEYLHNRKQILTPCSKPSLIPTQNRIVIWDALLLVIFFMTKIYDDRKTGQILCTLRIFWVTIDSNHLLNNCHLYFYFFLFETI